MKFSELQLRLKQHLQQIVSKDLIRVSAEGWAIEAYCTLVDTRSHHVKMYVVYGKKLEIKKLEQNPLINY